MVCYSFQSAFYNLEYFYGQPILPTTESGDQLPVLCNTCTRGSPCQFYTQRPLDQQYHHEFGFKGLIAQLPLQSKVDRESIAHQQLNDGAFQHPCVIYQTSSCDHLAYCLPATSFGGKTVTQRFRSWDDSWARTKRMNKYLPLEGEKPAEAHNANGTLKHDGCDMPSPTKIELDGGYWIEIANLEPFRGPARRLTGEALEKLDKILTRSRHHNDERYPPPQAVSRTNVSATLFVQPPKTSKAILITPPPTPPRESSPPPSAKPTEYATPEKPITQDEAPATPAADSDDEGFVTAPSSPITDSAPPPSGSAPAVLPSPVDRQTSQAGQAASAAEVESASEGASPGGESTLASKTEKKKKKKHKAGKKHRGRKRTSMLAGIEDGAEEKLAKKAK